MPEKFLTFTQLSAREDFIEFCRHDNFKSNNIYYAIFFTTLFTGVLISPQPDQERNMLQRPNSDFCKPLKKKKSEFPIRPPRQQMTSASDEKWRPYNCFFSRVGLRTYQHPCKRRDQNLSLTVSETKCFILPESL